MVGRLSVDSNSNSLDFIEEELHRTEESCRIHTRSSKYNYPSFHTSQSWLLERKRTRMDSVTVFVLLGCWSVSLAQSESYSMVFCGGTQLLVNAGEEAADCDEDDGQNQTAGSSLGPTVQILSSPPLLQDPGSPHLLVCLITGLDSPVHNILWGVNDTLVTSAGATVSLMMSEGGAYSASSVWEVSAADWRSRSTFWCGTNQEGRVYKQTLCCLDGQ